MPPRHPLSHLFYLDIWRWDPLLQCLARPQVLPEPEALFFFIHHPLWHWWLPQLRQPEDPISTWAEVVSRLLLGVPSAVADLNLFEEKIHWKGETGGNIRLVKATVLRVAAMCPPPHFHHSPNQLRATTVWMPAAGRHGQAGSLPRLATR